MIVARIVAKNVPEDNAMDDPRVHEDARHLQVAQEIAQDPARHEAAMNHLAKTHGVVKAALHEAKRKLHSKVKAGLAKSFPTDAQPTNPKESSKMKGKM
jgi:hypothetical protein